MAGVEKVSFPQGKIYVKQNSNGKDIINSAYIVWNKGYENKINSNFNQTQVFLDNKVVRYLQEYVSKKTGTQEKSIRLATKAGSGEVWIGVPYAAYQAYSPKIGEPKGKRGKRPFERMKADKYEALKNQLIAYIRRNNG